ncbi:MAG: ATP phosphoribosyltransferase [Ruminococcus sp.]|nr:ATP phosphoribosyltransferase [Ruminococcus sp.]
MTAAVNAESVSKRPLRIALTKGRLEHKTVDILEKLGFDVSEIHNKGRKLILEVKKNDTVFEVVLCKSPDVITYVDNGVCDIGVVGKDTISEHGGKFYELLDLRFGKCRFALCGKTGENFYSGINVKTIATKYPNVSRRFFESKGMDVDIVKIEGSVELAPLIGLSDAIVDIVETGKTLDENGLEIYETVQQLSARLIANRVSLKTNRRDIGELIKNLESV